MALKSEGLGLVRVKINGLLNLQSRSGAGESVSVASTAWEASTATRHLLYVHILIYTVLLLCINEASFLFMYRITTMDQIAWDGVKCSIG